MTKAELVNEISVRTGISREDTLIVVEGFMSEVKRAMRKGDVKAALIKRLAN